MRPKRTGQNGRDHHSGADQRKSFIRSGIQAAFGKRLGGNKEIKIAQNRRGQTAGPAKQQAVAHQGSPLIIVGRELREHGAARDCVECHGDAHPNRKGA